MLLSTYFSHVKVLLPTTFTRVILVKVAGKSFIYYHLLLTLMFLINISEVQKR